jgi:SynChlorMet cassette radical SAM/SPASM protein ScmF
LLCTAEIVTEIAKFPRRFVSVSIDGVDAATHEWVRGVAGSWEAARQAVRKLAQAGIQPQVIFSIMRGNADQVDAAVHMVEELGAASLKYNVVQPTARGEKLHDADAALSVAEIIQLGHHVEKDLAPTTKLRLHFDYPPAFRSLGYLTSGSGCGVCGILNIIGVIPTGYYALCGIGEQMPDLVFGAVGKDPLEKVWKENVTLVALREGLPDRLEGICGQCLMKWRCLGSCIAQNYYRSGNLWAPFWFCEEAEAEGLFPKSRMT